MSPAWEEEAQWIWHPDWTAEDENGTGKFVYFRKTFELDRCGDQCTIRISADSRYRLFLNGKLIGRGPCKGDRFTWYYDSIDVHNELVKGTNVLAVQVLRYPYAGGGNESVWRTRLPGLYVHAAVFDEAKREITRAHSDESWLCLKDEAIVLSQGVYTQFLGITESVNGCKRPFGWTETDYAAKDWIQAVPYTFDIKHGTLKPWELRERPIPFLYEKLQRFTGVSRLQSSGHATGWQLLLSNDQPLVLPENTSTVVDIDAGELTTGYPELLLSGGKDSEIRFICSECYENEPVEIPWLRDKGDRTDSAHGDLYGDADVYRPAGIGMGSPGLTEHYEPFWFRTFRYIRLEIRTGAEPLTLHRFTYRETGYPLEVKASYQSSDPSEAKLWDISVRTLRRCMHETYEDCPYYEQLQYVMDTRSQILFTYYLSGDDRLARRTLFDFHSSLLPEGLTQSRYPSMTPQVIPGFSLYWIMMLYDHMMFAGDRELVKRYLPGVDAVLGYFHRLRDDRGLVGAINPRYWSFVDWADRWKEDFGVPEAAKDGPLTVYNLMYTYALGLAAELAAYVGRAGLSAEYRDRAQQMREAVRAHCRSSTLNGVYTDGPGIELFSQHAQIWAVLSQTMTGEEARQAMKISLDNPAFVPCSFAMAFYLFRALAEVDLYEEVYDLLEPWRGMAGQNLTTWMEDTVSQRSDCHAWGSVPVYEYAAETLGVKAAAPRFGEIVMQPRIGKLNRAAGRVMTSQGAVDVAWRLEQSQFHLYAKWPEHVPCTFRLPDGQSVRIESGGEYTTVIKMPDITDTRGQGGLDDQP
ncbi:alpha-L-rhamnosidase-related protein [Paenibacillus phocaensis]|uniref:alpha-L-rhamnosidase-related protein n=1 Tax=Paenibacillus phocaensis TaxID=1776378 RepID=UPI000839C5C4|nr:alpha-L-rhamnosidase C-terminal domain-containing protein [Paenibacillus phocaensis]